MFDNLIFLQCFGIGKKVSGITGSTVAGHFDGTYLLQVADGTVVYAMAMPYARLSWVYGNNAQLMPAAGRLSTFRRLEPVDEF